ncbi:major facilitator superfamily domain-containing protein [Hyaloraphidium curvatum]|nr:major facilitator superfamily domain-containing protein [Hyaloraphidium curvatum]
MEGSQLTPEAPARTAADVGAGSPTTPAPPETDLEPVAAIANGTPAPVGPIPDRDSAPAAPVDSPAKSAALVVSAADLANPPAASSATVAAPPANKSAVAEEAAAAHLFSPAHKRLIVFVVAFAGFLGPIATAFYYPSMPQIAEDLGTTQALLNLTVTVFTLGLAFFPLFWASMSDVWGRRWIYISSLIIFSLGSVGCGLSPNIGVLIAMRVVQSCGGSALLTIGAGTISDIFVREERGRALGIYYTGPLLGPAISAPLGGVVAQYIGWRAIFYIAAGLAALMLGVIAIVLPETRKPKPGAKRRPNPFAAMVYLKHPFISLVTVNVSVVFGTTFAIAPEIPFLYSRYYNTSDLQNGLIYLGTSAGQLVGTVLGGYLADRNVRRWKEKRGTVMAEDRLRSAWLGSVFMPIGLLIFGWTIQNQVYIAVPIISQCFIGYAMMSISTPSNTFFTDAIYWSPASALSVNNMVRYIIGAVSPLYTPPAIKAIGPGWYYTIWAVANLFAGLAIAWVVRYGGAKRLAAEPWKTLEREKAEKDALEKVVKEGDDDVVVEVSRPETAQADAGRQA